MLQRNRTDARRRAQRVWQVTLIFSLLFVTGALHLWQGSAKAAASARPITSQAGNNILVTNTRDDGFPAVIGSLRRAIETTAASSGDTITFAIPTTDPGYNQTTGVFTIRLTRGPLNLYKSLTINGPGADKLTISGGGRSILFISTPPGAQREVTITDLTFANGEVQGTGGAIYSESTGALNLTGVAFYNNLAHGRPASSMAGSTAGQGGALYNQSGALNLMNVTFSNNEARGGQGPAHSPAAHGLGGAIYNQSGALDLTNVSFYSNRAIGGGGSDGAGRGGAIFNGGGTLKLLNCTFSGNSATGGQGLDVEQNTYPGRGGDGEGGAVYNGGALNINNSTFTNNSVIGGAGGTGRYGEIAGDGSGGALFHGSKAGVVTDSRFSTNTATGGKGGNNQGLSDAGAGGGGQGGAIAVRSGAQEGEPGALQLTNNQFTGNSARGGAGGAVTSTNCLDNPPVVPVSGNGGSALGGGLFSADTALLAVVGGTFADNTTNVGAIGGGAGGPCSSYKVGRAGASNGSAIYATALNLTGSTIRGNAIISRPGSDSNIGDNLILIPCRAAVFGFSLKLTNVLVDGNRGLAYGAGVCAGYNLTMIGSTVSNNVTNPNGGGAGISTYGANQITITITNSTITGNRAAIGAGLLTQFLTAGSVIRNSTISNNLATAGGRAAGIYNEYGSLLIDSCTIAFNTLFEPPQYVSSAGVSVSSRANFSDEPAWRTTSTELRNSIVYSGTSSYGPDVDSIGIVGNPGATVSLKSGGYNLLGSTGWPAVFSAPGDQIGTQQTPLNPLLGPLADNGGPTLTHTLLPGSPAIDKGNSFGLTTDQRGRPRPYNSGLTPAQGGDLADIGALELQPSPCTTITLTPTSLPGGAPGASYYQTITAQGSASSYQFAVTGGSLPFGLTLSPEGLLSGTLRSSGTYNFTITATDNAGCNGSQNYSLEIPCQIVTATLSGGGTISPGSSATLTVSLAGGAAPYTVSLNNNGGTLSGNSPLQFTVSPSATTTYAISAATEAGGCPVTASGNATVTVASDTTPPTLTCPGNQTGVISGAAGPITYPAPTVSDNLPGATFTCTPASGSNFLLGTTTVNCTARDAAGNTAACSFTVTARQPRPAIKDLITKVRALVPPLATGQVNGLINQLELANTRLEQGRTGQACTHLQNFAEQVKALVADGRLTTAQGQPLLDEANKIRAAIRCS